MCNPTEGTRRPANSGVVYNILKVNDFLEEIRRMYGGRPYADSTPGTVTRPPMQQWVVRLCPAICQAMR